MEAQMQPTRVMKPKRRKRRCDTIHLVYKIELINTPDFYIGVTAKEGPISKSLNKRWTKHISRAMCEGHDWALCNAIRQHGKDAFRIEAIDAARGKATGHTLERSYIDKLKPTLNTDTRPQGGYQGEQ